MGVIMIRNIYMVSVTMGDSYKYILRRVDIYMDIIK